MERGGVMLRRVFTHAALAPALVVAALLLGSATVVFLLVGPGLAPWADTLLTVCFGWNSATRHYRVDGLLLAVLQPLAFAGVVALFYGEELRAFLRWRPGGAVLGLAGALFLGLAGYLLATGEISATGAPLPAAALPAPLRQGAPGPAFALVDHQGQAVSERTLRGRPVVLTFVYADCHATCPALLGRLQALERAVSGDAAFVAVTLDPERDTVAALAGHARRWGLGPRWHLLTGDPGAVGRLVAAHGVQWTRLPGGEIAHDNVVVLLDRAGRVAFTYRGLAHPDARLAGDLTRLVAERS
jgi:protein SCO1/2